MIKIKINASDEIREVTFSRRSEHVIELGGIADAPTTGFTTWRMDGVTRLGDFSDYTTVYRTLDNAVQLSDDGSVYVEPEVPEPGEPQPTQEERIKALEDQNETLLQCILEMSEIVYALNFWIARDERKGRRYDGYDLGTADYAWEEDFCAGAATAQGEGQGSPDRQRLRRPRDGVTQGG